MMRQFVFSLRKYMTQPTATTAQQVAEEIKEELAFHLSQRAEEYRAQGIDGQHARDRALARFGDISQIAAQCQRVDMLETHWIHRMHLGMTTLLAITVCSLFVIQLRTKNAAGRVVPVALASMLDDDWSGRVYGTVRDDLGRPLPAARLLISVKTWPDGSFCQRAYTAVTDADGRFEVAEVCPQHAHYEVQVAAIAANREMRSLYRAFESGGTEPLEFRLPAASGLTLYLRDDDGDPLSDVQVLPQERIDGTGNRHLIYFDSGQSIIDTTDEAGRIHWPFFQPGDELTILVCRDNQWRSLSTLDLTRDELKSTRSITVPVPTTGGI